MFNFLGESYGPEGKSELITVTSTSRPMGVIILGWMFILKNHIGVIIEVMVGGLIVGIASIGWGSSWKLW